MSQESDDVLVQRIRRGEAAYFRLLVERYQDAVFGVALSRTGRHADAQDIAQEAFLAAFRALDGLRDASRFGKWLYGIALNQARMHLRKRRTREAAEQARPLPAAPDRRPEAAAARAEVAEAVMAALARLPEANREAATLFYINGYSVEDIGRFTNRPVGTVKRRLHVARNQLREELIVMVEDELKRSRPGREFTDEVLRRIVQIRLNTREDGGALCLTDAKGISFVIMIGLTEAKALEPWLEGRGNPESLDLHTAAVRCLRAMDRQIEQATITELSGRVFLAKLRASGGGRCLDLDCRPSDLVNFAIRAGVAVLVNKAVSEAAPVRGPDGKPATPAQVEKDFARTIRGPVRGPVQPIVGQATAEPTFKNMDDVLVALELNPWHPELRHTVMILASGAQSAPKVQDVRGAPERFRAWVQRVRGTDLESLAQALVGASRLWTLKQPAEAIAPLEGARKLAPNDVPVLWDLASAYARADRAGDALAILRQTGLTLQGKDARLLARQCGNFAPLWGHPAFKQLVGDPDARWEHGLIMGVPVNRLWDVKVDTKDQMGEFRAWLDLLGPLGGQPTKPAPLPAELAQARPPRPGEALIERCRSLLGVASLGAVRHISRTGEQTKTRYRVVLELGRQERLSFKVSDTGRVNDTSRNLIEMAFSADAPRPQTPRAVCDLLAGVGLEMEAAALVQRSRSRLEGALLVRDGKRRAVVAADVAGALAMGIAAKCHVLIARARRGHA